MFADLHSHPHIRAYMCLTRDHKKWKKKGKYNPWTIVAANLTRLQNVDRAAGYSQADMVALWNGQVRLVFCSLYPIEKDFFVTPDRHTRGDFSWLREIVRVVTHHKTPFRLLLQQLTMRIPNKFINYVSCGNYDYWESLQDEYNFVCDRDGKTTLNHIYTLGFLRKIFEVNSFRRKKYPKQYEAKGVYKIPKNKKEAILIAKNKDIIMMPLTIEGGHVFEGLKVCTKEVLNRIDFIKKNWQHPVFFITFTHHFNNGFCGHAHSLSKLGAYVANQDEGMNQGFTPLGQKVVRKLLSIDENNEKIATEPYRILIDIKHLSAKGRKEFYSSIINPCFEKGDLIPVIASHSGFSGYKMLDDMIANEANEKDSTRIVNEDGVFYAWSINFCEEDINMIYKTKGLFGLSFDRKIVGVSQVKQEAKNENINNIKALWNNLKAVLNVIYRNPKYSLTQKRAAWNMLSLGTDYDGYIEAIKDYKTANELGQFKKDLLAIIKKEAAAGWTVCTASFDQKFTPELVVNKICYDNILAFALEHYPTKKYEILKTLA